LECLSTYILLPGFKKGGIPIPGCIYIQILLYLDVTGGFLFWNNKNFYSFLIYLGCNIFCISDFILARRMFFENNPYYQFIIMSTYITAQTLISIGMSDKNGESIKKEMKIE